MLIVPVAVVIDGDVLPAFAVITPLPSIVIEVPSTLTPPNVVVVAVGNVYAPALALRTPLASIVKLLPTLIHQEQIH